jgi:hypothetical protein
MAFDNIVGTTLERYFTSGKATDNIFKRTAVLDFLKRRAKIESQGGRTAVMPVMGATNSTFQNYSGYDTLTPAVDELIDTAVYQWKQSAIYVPISGIEEAKNSGDKAVIKLLKTKTENAEMTAAETFEDMLFNATGTSQVAGKAWSTTSGAKDWAGLASIVGTTNSVGGIDGNTQTWWRSHVTTAADATMLADLANAYNTVSYGADKCDFEVTTQALYEKYEAKLQANQRFTDATTGKAGFDNLIHKGGVVVWSDYTPSGEWYFLNSRHIKLVVLDGKWMKFKGFVEPYDKDARYGLIVNYGTFATDGRRYLGKRTGFA